MLVRSPSGCSSSPSVVAFFAIGADSPVSAASWTSSDADEMIRASAGTRSPASTSRMSPGTSPTASTSSTVPSRRTRAVGTCNWASASTLAIALRSWLVPMTTLNSTSAITIAPVAIWSDREAGDADDQQHDVHRVGDLRLGHLPRRRWRFGGHLVLAVGRQAARDLGRAEARRCVDAESRDGVVDRQRVPLRVGGAVAGLVRRSLSSSCPQRSSVGLGDVSQRQVGLDVAARRPVGEAA